MFNPDTAPVSVYMPSFETAARSLKVELITAPVHSDDVRLVSHYCPNVACRKEANILKDNIKQQL